MPAESTRPTGRSSAGNRGALSGESRPRVEPSEYGAALPRLARRGRAIHFGSIATARAKPPRRRYWKAQRRYNVTPGTKTGATGANAVGSPHVENSSLRKPGAPPEARTAGVHRASDPPATARPTRSARPPGPAKLANPFATARGNIAARIASAAGTWCWAIH